MDTIRIQDKTYVLKPIEEYMDERIGREEIASYLECNRAMLSRKPWIFPDFGEAVKGLRGAKPYRRQDVLDWLSIPEKKRKRLFLEKFNSSEEIKDETN